MKVLVFALLALAVSADNYGYGHDYGYPSSWSSSYPTSYGSYGGGYGSSLYGASYGSGIGYDIGGGSYSAGYAPAMYKTAKYPQGNVAAYHGEGYRYSMPEEPVKIMLEEEFSGVDEHSGYQLGTPEVQTYGVPQPVIAHEVLSNYKNDNPSKMAFIPDIPRFDELPNYRPVVNEKFPVSSQKSGFSTIGGRSQASITRDFPKVTLKTAVPDRQPAIQAVNKVINPRMTQKQQTTGYVHRTSPVYKSRGPEYATRVHPQISFVLGGVDILQPGYKPVTSFAPKPTYVRSGSVGYVPKNTAQSFSSRSGPSRITFTRDFSKIHNQQPVRKQETSNFGNVGAPVFPGVVPSGGYIGQRSKTSFVSPPKPIQKPIAQEQDFTAVDELPPHSADYTRENKHPGYVLVPETTYTNDKSSADFSFTSDINSEYEKPFPLKYYAESGGNAKVQDASSGHGTGSRSYNILPGSAEEASPTFYDAVPEDHGNDKSSISFHSADISAPTGSFIEEKRPSYLISPIRTLGKHAAAPVQPNHDPQLPVA